MTQPPVRWLFPVFALALLFVSHLPFLSLPFYWDELGQFIPASLDIYQQGAWVPRTTLPNVHPPGLMTYLAAVWSIVGYSIPATRLAVLWLAAASLYAVWLLGEALEVPAGPRRFAILLLLASPLFYTQSMMAQLELPALLFTVLALALFLRRHYGLAVLACAVLVLMKETGALVPVLLAGWSAREGNYRRAAMFLLPLCGLAIWLLVLRSHTGQSLGNEEFARYNLFYPLHPVRLSAALLRRVYYLFGSSFHWIGTLALLTVPRFLTGRWRLAGAFLVLHTLEVSVLGGATLERYLLPVLPVLYLAMATACWQKAWIWRTAFLAGLAASLWMNPLYPFPFENNLAFTDFVRLQQAGAAYLEQHQEPEPITTVWPFTDALRRPEFGYVQRARGVQGIEDFRRSEILKASGNSLAVYTRTWRPAASVLNWPWVSGFLQRFYGYEPAIELPELEASGWKKTESFTRRGQTLTLFERQPKH